MLFFDLGESQGSQQACCSSYQQLVRIKELSKNIIRDF